MQSGSLRPVDEASRERVAALEVEVAAGERELAALKTDLHAVQTQYLEKIGPLYAELIPLDDAVAEAEIRAGLRVPDEEPPDAFDARTGNFDVGCKPSPHLKRMFHDIARAVHPDRSPHHEADERTRFRRHSLMAEANRAYAERDEDRLRLILRAWELGPDTAVPQGEVASPEQLQRRAAALAARTVEIQAELADLRRLAIARLKIKIDEAKAQGWDLFGEMIRQIKREITMARATLVRLERRETQLGKTRTPLVLAFLATSGVLFAQAPTPPPVQTPSFATVDGDVKAGAYGNVDRIYAVERGRTIADFRYTRDYREISRGRVSAIGCGEGCPDATKMHQFNYFHPNWHPFFSGRAVHTLQSVTKSVAATLIGVAIARGDLGADAIGKPFLEFFKEYDLSRIDPRLRRATLEDVLTMRSGIEWHEQDRPLNETNTTVQLEWSQDWIQFTLNQPMDADPGTKWAYNSGGSQLLSHVIRRATGQHIDDYARAHLFGPLGIRDFHWKRTPTGHPDTEGGLYLTAEDLAKIGSLYLAGGLWNGRRVLPEGFTARATTRHARAVAPGWDYGYQWWITQRGTTDIWAGRGFGGQFLIVIPSREISAAILSWNVFGGPSRNIFTAVVDALLARDSKSP